MKRYNMHFYSMEEKNLQQFGTEHRYIYIYIYYNKIKWKKKIRNPNVNEGIEEEGKPKRYSPWYNDGRAE